MGTVGNTDDTKIQHSGLKINFKDLEVIIFVLFTHVKALQIAFNSLNKKQLGQTF